MISVILTVLKWLWQLLRVVAFLLVVLMQSCNVLSVVQWVKSPERKPVFHDPYVCGQISGYVLRFPVAYVPYWAEYEGLSSWEPGFTKNKKGCGANLTELSLVTSWPEMKPYVSAYFAAGFAYDFDGLNISIKPSSRVAKNMPGLLEFMLEDLSPEQQRSIEYVENLGLYHVRGFDSIGPDSLSDFYWSESDGEILHVVDCLWLPIQKRTSSCRIRFFYPELEAFVKIEFQVEKLSIWQDVVRVSTGFLSEGLIGSE
ncbi:MAG: hypothetical protein LBJ37_19870 [Paucimonas sp.]|jgi:hypothetical protein|nr:hypothetical protein [Paucimonas sp.]